MKQSHFFAHLSRLKLINRWPLMRNVRTENVSEHSLQVAMVAHALAAIKNRKFGGNVNAERIALLAMYHDASEVLTGDLPTPVKYFNSQIAQEYKAIEKIAQQKLVDMVPEELRDIFAPLIDEHAYSDEEKSLVKQALLNSGDEMLVPAPDYPLWTAAVSLSSGKAVHYLCDESSDWFPDLDDIRAKITPRTRGIVIINPNNPTGAVYSKELLMEIVEIARQHNLIIFADEIYDKILYDDAEHHSIAPLAPDLLTITFNGLSKTYRVAGFRQGWMVLNGPKKHAKGYIEGLEMLASMRLCANVPAQHAIQTALGGYQSISEFITPGGRLYEQRNRAWELINDIPGVSCVKPRGALYMFPKIDAKRFNIHDDQKMVLDFLLQEKVLLVQGTAFNWPWPDHFRIVTLPRVDDIELSLSKFARFLSGYHQL